MMKMRSASLIAQVTIWASTGLFFIYLFRTSLPLSRGIVIAASLTAGAAATAYATTLIMARCKNAWLGWLMWGAAILSVTPPFHAWLRYLGMRQSFGQDVVNLIIISGIAALARLAWSGLETKMRLKRLEREYAQYDAIQSTDYGQQQANPNQSDKTRAALKAFEPIPVNVGKGQVFVNMAEVSHIEASGNFSILHTGTPVFASEPLKALSSRLADYGLIRVHRSYLVNRGFFDNRQSRNLYLKSGHKIPIGRAYLGSITT